MLKIRFFILLFYCSLSFSQDINLTPSFKSENKTELGIGYGILGWDHNNQMWSLNEGELISFDGSNSRKFKVPKYKEKFGEDGFGTSRLDLANNRIIIGNIYKSLFLVYDITENSFKYIENNDLFEEKINILDIYPFKDDKYFVATYGFGVLLLDIKKNKITSFDRTDHPESQGIPSDNVKSISRFDENTFIFGFFHESNKKAVIQFYDTKNKKFSPLNIEEYFRDEPEFYRKHIATSTRIVHKLDVDENKNIIAATYSFVLKIDTQNKRIYRITANKDLDETVQNIDNSLDFIRDDRGLYWVITANTGIMLVDIDNNSAKYIQNDPNNESSISSNYPSRLRMDPDGNIWITHRNSDLIDIFGRTQLAFEQILWGDLNLKYYDRSRQNIPISNIHVYNDSMLFIASGNGLHLYNPINHKDTIVLDVEVYFENELKKNKNDSKAKSINTTVLKDDKIYFSKFSNFYVYDIKKKKVKRLKWENGVVSSGSAKPIFLNPNKNSKSIYFSWYSRIFKIDTDNQSVSSIGSIELKNNEGKGIYPVNSKGVQLSDDEVFLQLGEQSFGKLNLKTLDFIDYNENLKVQSLDPTEIFFQAEKASDSILATTESGFISMNKFKKINILNESINFGTDKTPFSFLLKNDTLLFFTTLNEFNLLNLSTNKSESYGKVHGLKIDRFLPYDIQTDQKSNLYLISANGLLILNPEKLKIFEEPFNIDLASIISEEDTTYFGFNKKISASQKMEFNKDVSTISFKIRTNQTYSAESPEFFYRLNKNGQWISNGSSNEIRFSGLGFGNYELQVKAINAYGVKSNIYTQNFKIKAPFWLSWWGIIIALILLAISIFSLIKIRERKIQEKNRALEKIIAERTKEVVEQKDEAEFQRKTVEAKNKEILDSIQYAKRIQSAILPPNKLVKSYLNDSFILYLPKDVVAGDFYWVEPFEEGVIFAAADCTGHGVPGAMVSVVCNNGLNRSVREYKLSKPAQILDKTREIVIKEFEKSEEDVKDGMDISMVNLYSTDQNDTFIEYAGANNPLWIMRKGPFNEIEENDKVKSFNQHDGEYSLLEIKADKQPIGKYDQVKPYTNHKLKLKKGDAVYLFSDGLVDQFGGENLPNGRKGGKKYKPVNFRKLLFSIQEKPMNDQKTIIEEAFYMWKGDLDQVDDVCVIGVRI